MNRRDDALDALAWEATRRRRKRRNPQYSYGKLVAETTEAQRREIVERYRARRLRRRVAEGASLMDAGALRMAGHTE